MILLALLAAIGNIGIYIYQYIDWRKDCKEIGKENLAVSLSERMEATALCITLPCVVGLLMRH